MRRLTGGRLVVATHNAGKLLEIAQLLAPYGVTLSSNADHGLPEPEETEETFVGNARIKAHAAARATGLPALADDSGIEVEALGGAQACIPRIGPKRRRGGILTWPCSAPGMRWSRPVPPNRGARGSAAPWFWHGPMATTRFSKVGSRVASPGQNAATWAMGMTRSSSPTVMI